MGKLGSVMNWVVCVCTVGIGVCKVFERAVIVFRSSEFRWDVCSSCWRSCDVRWDVSSISLSSLVVSSSVDIVWEKFVENTGENVFGT